LELVKDPRNAPALRELRQRAPHIPLIIDAGIGLPSHACQVMEWGFERRAAKHKPFRVPLTQSEWRAPLRRLSELGRSAFLGGPMTVPRDGCIEHS